jgi:hypothetical protein
MDPTRLLQRLERAQRGRARYGADVLVTTPANGDPEPGSSRALHRYARYHALVHGLSLAFIQAQRHH